MLRDHEIYKKIETLVQVHDYSQALHLINQWIIYFDNTTENQVLFDQLISYRISILRFQQEQELKPFENFKDISSLIKLYRMIIDKHLQASTLEDFVQNFNDFFLTHQVDRQKKLHPRSMIEETAISCTGAIILLFLWLNKNTNSSNYIFLIDNNDKTQHTYLDYVENDERNRYHWNKYRGLEKINIKPKSNLTVFYSVEDFIEQRAYTFGLQFSITK